MKGIDYGLVLLGVLCSTTACSSDDADQKGGDGHVAHCAPQPMEWSACPTLNADCGSIVVPVDHDEPSGATYRLDVARVPATNAALREGMVVLHPGGVAKDLISSTQTYFELAPAAAPELLERHDLVVLNPRGAAGDSQFDCIGYDAIRALDPTPDDAAEWQQLFDFWRDLAEDCVGARPAEELARFGTREAVRDLDCLIEAMGDDQLIYAGISHGSLVGAAFATTFPEHVQRMVLDAAVAPAPDFPAHYARRARAAERGFLRLVAACAADAACAFHPAASEAEISTAYDALAAKLDAATTPPRESDLHIAAYAAAADNDGSKLWPALALAESGDGSALAALAEKAWNEDVHTHGRYYALAPDDFPCPEGWDLAQAQQAISEVRVDAPHLAPAVMTNALICLAWPIHGEPIEVNAPTTPPALVVGGNLDISTPVENAQALADALDNGSFVLLHDQPGHGGFMQNFCVTAAELAFLTSGAPPPAACPAN